jgi:hypothetical protein
MRRWWLDDTNKGPTNTSAETAPYSGATGTIAGVITFNGTPPAAKKIDTTADPVCGQKNPNLTTDDTIVKDGKLANVFVYIKEGTVEGGKKIGDYAWPLRPLRQARSEWLPLCTTRAWYSGESETEHHQQRRDSAQHSPDTEKLNPEWNQTQPNGAPPIEKTFARLKS